MRLIVDMEHTSGAGWSTPVRRRSMDEIVR